MHDMPATGLLCCALLLAAPAAAEAEARESCLDEPDMPRRIAACTDYIDHLEDLTASLGGLVGLQMRKVALAQAYAARGMANSAQTLLPEALADFQMAVALDGRTARYVLYRGQAYERLGITEAAIADYRYGLSINPDLAPAQDALRRLSGDTAALPPGARPPPARGAHWQALPNGRLRRVPD